MARESIITNLDSAFVKHYEAEVHNAYQRMGSKLRNTVRTRNNIRGSHAVFHKIGKLNVSEKAYGAQISTSGTGAQTPAQAELTNYYVGEWVDTLDEIKTSTDEKMALAQAGAYALGRKTDDLIIQAMTNHSGSAGATSAPAGLTRDKILETFQLLGENDVPDDGQRYALVGWKQWSDLLKISEFASSDYVGDENLPWKGTQAKQWLGTLWMPHSGLTKVGSKRTCLWYHQSAIGHAIGKDITTDISWHGDYASHFVNNMMSQGATVIDERGFFKISVTET